MTNGSGKSTKAQKQKRIKFRPCFVTDCIVQSHLAERIFWKLILVQLVFLNQRYWTFLANLLIDLSNCTCTLSLVICRKKLGCNSTYWYVVISGCIHLRQASLLQLVWQICQDLSSGPLDLSYLVCEQYASVSPYSDFSHTVQYVMGLQV